MGGSTIDAWVTHPWKSTLPMPARTPGPDHLARRLHQPRFEARSSTQDGSRVVRETKGPPGHWDSPCIPKHSQSTAHGAAGRYLPRLAAGWRGRAMPTEPPTRSHPLPTAPRSKPSIDRAMGMLENISDCAPQPSFDAHSGACPAQSLLHPALRTPHLSPLNSQLSPLNSHLSTLTSQLSPLTHPVRAPHSPVGSPFPRTVLSSEIQQTLQPSFMSHG
jgi:hypothetical protein